MSEKEKPKHTAQCNGCGMKFIDSRKTLERLLSIQHTPSILKHSCGGEIVIFTGKTREKGE